jgi:peptidoglycan/LPS O-acetylase OafA/YrhL
VLLHGTSLSEYYYLIYAPLSAILITILAYRENIKAFSAPLVIFLGEVSFSFYLIHNLVLRYLKHGLIKFAHYDIAYQPVVIQIIIAIITLGAVIATSIGLYNCVEVPYRDKIKALLLKKTQKTA